MTATTTSAAPVHHVTDGAAPPLHRDHDPLIEIRLGHDLVLQVCPRASGLPSEPDWTRHYVIALDSEGNYLSTLATLHNAAVTDAVLAAATQTARELYPAHVAPRAAAS